jgi:predicted nucleotidyltransferase
LGLLWVRRFYIIISAKIDNSMIAIIEQNLGTLKKLCRRFHVCQLELIGSALASEEFNLKESDLDFLVEFQPLKPGEYADTYFGLLEALENLFARHVDLVMVRAVKNPYFLESINKNRKVLYAA